MSRPFPKCPGTVYSVTLPLKGTKQESHNLTSYWTQEGDVIHKLQTASLIDNPNQIFLKQINSQLLQSYARIAADTSMNVREMWVETTTLVPETLTGPQVDKPTIRIFYSAILNSTGTASALSHLHNLAKQELSEAFRPDVNLHINSQLLVR